MIWTITPNPALDITWHVPGWERGESIRVKDVSERPGGKGLNVARVLDQVNTPVTASGFLGGAPGTRVMNLLSELSPEVHTSWITTSYETRRSIAVVDTDPSHGDTTIFNEAGSTATPSDWENLRTLLAENIQADDVVTVSGSMPGDSPFEELAQTLQVIRSKGALVILDTSGPHLLETASYAHVIKPNKDELAAATGVSDIYEGAQILLDRGVSWVVVSLGKQGMQIHTRQGIWKASARPDLSGNPTGAGDAAVAALCRVLSNSSASDRQDIANATSLIEDALADAVATSVAAVVCPVAGEIDTQLREEILEDITVERIHDHAS